jgi:O-antigen ligase
VFAAIVVAAIAAGLHAFALRYGPATSHLLTTVLTRDVFIDQSLSALHTGLLLLEGLLLFAHAARLGTAPGTLRLVCAATAAGAAAAAVCNVGHLVESAVHAGAFWPSLVDLAAHVRWNVHYADMNAAGSFFALALLAAAALAWSSNSLRRGLWTACASASGIGLWLTSSRVAMLAVPAAAAVAILLPRVIRGRRQALVAAGVALAAGLLLIVAAVLLPQRGLQRSPFLAADVRVGLIETGVRMVREYPAYGVGLGQFHERSGEFSSLDLLQKFPAAVHENAHNNFVQVTAETGIPGGLAFTWLIGAVLLALGWRSTTTRDPLLTLAFAALTAFVLTMFGGHPLLVPEAAYTFWIVAGAAAGAAIGERGPSPRGRQWTLAVAAPLAGVALTLPLRLEAAGRDVDLEHVGFGVSHLWQTSPDGVRYREATGQATLFVPQTAFKFSAQARTTEPVQLEVTVDGRRANVIVLAPGQWTDIVVQSRTTWSDSRFRRMDLRAVASSAVKLWLTKDEPVASR